MATEERRIEDELSYPILLSERVRTAVDQAKSFKLECSEVGKQVDRLSQNLRTVVRFATSAPVLYERPIRCIVAEVSKNLERALTLVRKCKRRSFLRRVVTITRATDFRKLFNFLESSVGDMKWLLSILDPDTAANNGIELSLAPIACNDPILSWVWSFIATVQMGSAKPFDQPSLRQRATATGSSSSKPSAAASYTEVQIVMVRQLSLKVHPDKNKAPRASET